MSVENDGTLNFNVTRLWSWVLVLYLAGCNSVPTRTQVVDLSQAGRTFKAVTYGVPEKVVLEKAVYVDTRSRFDYNMARTPRSFQFSPTDWQLFNYKGTELQQRKRELQRRLAINGVDPFVNVIIISKPDGGDGEASYATAVLMALGIEKIAVMTDKDLSKAMIRGARVEGVANLGYWQRKMKHNFSCGGKAVGATQTVAAPKTKDGQPVFSKDFLALKSKNKKPIVLKSGQKYHAYGLALELLKRGQAVCVVDPFDSKP